MGFHILVRQHVYIESEPRSQRSIWMMSFHPHKWYIIITSHRKKAIKNMSNFSVSTLCFWKPSTHVRCWDICRCSDDLIWLPFTQYIPRINSLAPGRFRVNFRWVIFKLILVVNGWGISCEIALIWISLDHTYDKSTLVQVMAWCRQATSHYLSLCWPRSLSPYGVTGPQWVNSLGHALL